MRGRASITSIPRQAARYLTLAERCLSLFLAMATRRAARAPCHMKWTRVQLRASTTGMVGVGFIWSLLQGRREAGVSVRVHFAMSALLKEHAVRAAEPTRRRRVP